MKMKRCWIAWVSMLLVLALLLSCAALADELELANEYVDLTLADQEGEALDLEITIDEAEVDIPVAPDELSGNELSLEELSLDEAFTLGNDTLEAGADGGEAAVNEISGGLGLTEDPAIGYGEPVTMHYPDQIFAALEMDPYEFHEATGASTVVTLFTSELVEDECVDKWEIEDESIITLDDVGGVLHGFCRIVALKPGTTTIKATTNMGRYGSVTINVEVYEALTIDDAHFPDPSFRNYLLSCCSETVEKLKANVIPKEWADRWDEMDLYKWGRQEDADKIRSLKGLEYFPALEYLDLDYSTDLTELDLSHNPKLTKVFCYGNKNLTYIDVSNCSKLEVLFCYENGLRTLDMSHCPNLYSLDCSENALTSLNVSGCTLLKAIYCDWNKLTELNLGNNPYMAYLECHHNPLASLSIAFNPTLVECFSKGSVYYHAFFTGEDAVSFVIERDGVDTTASGEQYGFRYNYLIVDQTCAIVFDGASHVIPPEPTPIPTAKPTAAPTARPTAAPTAKPTAAPTAKPTAAPTAKPTAAPTAKPTAAPTAKPTATPTAKPTATPTTKPASVKLNKTKASLKVGKKLTLKATVKPAGVKTTLTWSSSNKKVATVTKKGVVKAIKPGKATITVRTDNGKKASCKVTVLAVGTKIDKKHFPDAKFRKYVKTNFDKNKDGALSKAEIKAVKKIDVHYDGIASLKGVELFTNLTDLDCSYNKLASLDVRKNTRLKRLVCNGNKLTKLDVGKNTQLENLDCYNNKLKTLDVSKNTRLKNLDCSYNKLTMLDMGKNTRLKKLICCNNKLTKLDVTKSTGLKELNCFNNKLKSLNVEPLSRLESLTCNDNRITKLPLGSKPELYWMCISGNKIKSINIKSCDKLRELVNQVDPKQSSRGIMEWYNLGRDLEIDAYTKVMNGSTVVYEP